MPITHTYIFLEINTYFNSATDFLSARFGALIPYLVIRNSDQD